MVEGWLLGPRAKSQRRRHCPRPVATMVAQPSVTREWALSFVPSSVIQGSPCVSDMRSPDLFCVPPFFNSEVGSLKGFRPLSNPPRSPLWKILFEKKMGKFLFLKKY